MKKIMTSKQWLIAFAVICILLTAALMLLNYMVDPFGAFGDQVMQWWSYDMTLNPRVAKLSYLEQNHEKYDSYIIGSSSTSSYPVEQLNEYFSASFYNLIMYGADMLDVEQTCIYIAEHYEVKNLILNVYIQNAEIYNTEPDPLTYGMHYKADGSSAAAYYCKYFLADPRYAAEKLKKHHSDGYVQNTHDVFNVASGSYDKSRRDVQNISDLTSYYESYPVFLNYPHSTGSIPNLESCMQSLQDIKALCDEKGINFIVVCPPMYYEHYNYFSQEDHEAFNVALAQITPYWDFTLSSVSYEPRYFYDETHFRNAAGKMALARMFGDNTVYAPSDLGVYITAENVYQQMEKRREITVPKSETVEAQVPILLYHHIVEGQGEGNNISTANLEAHLKALSEAGFTAVTFDQLRDFVEHGTPLPDNSVVITFDDGYESNLTLGAPLLRKYNMNATVFSIGVSVGKDTYKDTGVEMLPHFSLEEALSYADVIHLGSHGYNIHEVSGRDPEPVRQGILQLDGEDESSYIRYLREDCRLQKELFINALGTTPQIFAYPYGFYSELSEIILQEEGIWATVTTEEKTNTLVKGLPQCLRQMGRYGITDETTPEQLLTIVSP